MAAPRDFGAVRRHLSTFGRLARLRWELVALLGLAAGFGFIALYSVAGGSFEPWVTRQIAHFALGFAVMSVVALVDPRIWRRYAYPAYGLALVLLIAVDLTGTTVMGAQRWLDLGVVRFQPTEIMKIALVLGLARYFSALPRDRVWRPGALVVPILLVAAPAILLLRQPDLSGTILIVLGGLAVLYLAGVRVVLFAVLLFPGLAAAPLTWEFLHDYQKQRVLAFLDPASDTLGKTYQILQSEIAFGAGGLFGKGFLAGVQGRHLNLFPEQQTDFIFSLLAEEFGLLGTLTVLAIYTMIAVRGLAVGRQSGSEFGRLLAMGLITTFFIQVFANIAVVTGMFPVTGVPLPLISYGGTAMLSTLVGFGLLMSTYVHRRADDGKPAAPVPGEGRAPSTAATPEAIFSRRAALLAASVYGLAVLLAARLCYLQLVSDQYTGLR